MTDLLQIVSTIAMLVLPPILLTRLIAGSEPISLADVLRSGPQPARPVGMQEDDQPAFRFDPPAAMRHLAAVSDDEPATCAAERAA